MNSKRSLMTALVGLAMLATPIAAAAHDYNHYDHAHARGPGCGGSQCESSVRRPLRSAATVRLLVTSATKSGNRRR